MTDPTEVRSIERLQDVKLWRRLQVEQGLSDRQIQVAILVVSGLTIRQIADRLNVSAGTTKTHYDRLKARLGVTDRSRTILALLHRSGLLLGDGAVPSAGDRREAGR